MVLILSKRDLATFIFCLITIFLILFFLEIRAARRQKSISVEFSFTTVFAFKRHVSAAYVTVLLTKNTFYHILLITNMFRSLLRSSLEYLYKVLRIQYTPKLYKKTTQCYNRCLKLSIWSHNITLYINKQIKFCC